MSHENDREKDKQDALQKALAGTDVAAKLQAAVTPAADKPPSDEKQIGGAKTKAAAFIDAEFAAREPESVKPTTDAIKLQGGQTVSPTSLGHLPAQLTHIAKPHTPQESGEVRERNLPKEQAEKAKKEAELAKKQPPAKQPPTAKKTEHAKKKGPTLEM